MITVQPDHVTAILIGGEWHSVEPGTFEVDCVGIAILLPHREPVPFSNDSRDEAQMGFDCLAWKKAGSTTHTYRMTGPLSSLQAVCHLRNPAH